MSNYKTLTLHCPIPQVSVLTFNRPEKLNAISWEMVEEIHQVLDTLETDTSTRVLILTGAGTGFCSGTDLKASAESQSKTNTVDIARQMRNQRRIADIPIRMRKIPQPIIAAVNGVAAGGGFSFAMACDLRIAVPGARFIASYINIGLSGGELGSSYFLPRLVGIARASDILYTGREVWGEEAAEIGLVSRLVDDGQCVDVALETAKVMLGKSPFGLKMTKEVLNHSVDAPNLEAAIYMENRTQSLAVATTDFREAVSAFQEKRPAHFSQD
jgi:enoyl-CoA hydratase